MQNMNKSLNWQSSKYQEVFSPEEVLSEILRRVYSTCENIARLEPLEGTSQQGFKKKTMPELMFFVYLPT